MIRSRLWSILPDVLDQLMASHASLDRLVAKYGVDPARKYREAVTGGNTVGYQLDKASGQAAIDIVGVLDTGFDPIGIALGETTDLHDLRVTLGVSAGALTLAKVGSTARTATFPDAAIYVLGSAAAPTATRVPYGAAGGVLTDSASFIYNGGLGIGASVVAYAGSLSLSVAAGDFALAYAERAGSVRWAWGMNGTAESGSNAGSDFIFRAYSDAAGLVGDALTFTRATMAATFGGIVGLGAAPTAGNGLLQCASGTTRANGVTLGDTYLFRAGAGTVWLTAETATLPAALGAFNVSGAIALQALAAAPNLYFQRTNGTRASPTAPTAGIAGRAFTATLERQHQVLKQTLEIEGQLREARAKADATQQTQAASGRQQEDPRRRVLAAVGPAGVAAMDALERQGDLPAQAAEAIIAARRAAGTLTKAVPFILDAAIRLRDTGAGNIAETTQMVVGTGMRPTDASGSRRAARLALGTFRGAPLRDDEQLNDARAQDRLVAAAEDDRRIRGRVSAAERDDAIARGPRDAFAAVFAATRPAEAEMLKVQAALLAEIQKQTRLAEGENAFLRTWKQSWLNPGEGSELQKLNNLLESNQRSGLTPPDAGTRP